MTASSLEVTPGSGLKLATNSYTETAVTVHSQNMINGEQYLADYTIVTGAPTLATANSHPLQIMAGAALRVRIRRIDVWQSAVATTAAFCQFDLVRLTTAGTGGTVLTPAQVDPADVASGATAMQTPTVKGTEGTIMNRKDALVIQTIPASNTGFPALVSWDFDKPRVKPLIIAAGATNGIAIKNITAIAAATVHIEVWLSESTF